ncbi:hypothetical protein F4803DRAFT_501685 [Xylaria telfairii]|nr:hypothetical protein F4803DRAFT_501685 [Xylaria telfairii]
MDQNQVQQSQPTQPTPAPFFNVSRRYACDRCRSHKLRCVRDHMSINSPCQRCRKARVTCTISSSIHSTASLDRLSRSALETSMPGSSSATSPTRPTNLTRPPQTPESVDNADAQNDSLGAAEVNWIDMLDPAFYLGEENETDVGGGIATITPQSQNASGAYQFPSAPGNFAFHPTYDTSGERNPSALEKESSGILTNRDLPPCRNDFVSNPPAQGHKAASDLAKESPASKTSTNSSILSPVHASSTQTAELKDALIQELSNLSTSLMKDLHRAIGCKLASSFLLKFSAQQPAEYLFKTLDGSTSQDNAIGRMLQGSEKFLEIMQVSLNQWCQPTPRIPDSLLGSDGLDFDTLEEPSHDSRRNSEARLERRWGMLQSYLEKQNPIPTPLTSESFGLSHQPDITSKLAVLTCYTCLLRIYETVFFVIHHTLEVSPSLAPSIKLPQTVPGLEINGFLLNKHRSLQIKILIQASTYMLDSIEKSMHSLLSDPTFQALLKTVLRQEGLECAPGNETGMDSARRLMEKVNQALD